MVKAFVSTCVAAALVCGLSAPAAAYTFDNRTLFTFSRPIALPGVTLPAGTYTFRLADPTTARKVVQVLNHNGTQSYALLLSIPAMRADIPTEPEISFMETAAGMPAAVKIWWQEGSTRGYEFIYPKAQADRLARGVLTAPKVAEASPPAFTEPEAAGRSSGSPAFVEPDAEKADASESGLAVEAGLAAEAQDQFPQPAPRFAQEPVPSPAQEPAPSPGEQGTREQLPSTATLIPLAVMAGSLMLFGGGWLMRKVRKPKA